MPERARVKTPISGKVGHEQGRKGATYQPSRAKLHDVIAQASSEEFVFDEFRFVTNRAIRRFQLRFHIFSDHLRFLCRWTQHKQRISISEKEKAQVLLSRTSKLFRAVTNIGFQLLCAVADITFHLSGSLRDLFFRRNNRCGRRVWLFSCRSVLFVYIQPSKQAAFNQRKEALRIAGAVKKAMRYVRERVRCSDMTAVGSNLED